MTTAATRDDALRIAVCQVRMAWEGDDNTATACAAIALAAREGARIALLPELSLTGIHRRIREMAVPARVAGWLDAVRAACAAHRIAACVGAPTFTDGGARHISQHVIDPDGALIATVHKRGLTAAEATFFTAADQRAVVPLLGRRWGTMICREIDDHELLVPRFLADRPDIVLWPGGMRPDPDKPRIDPPEHVQRAQSLARECDTAIVMINWPNALNRPEESAECGASVVIGRSGALRLALPKAQAGVALIDLDEGDVPLTARWWAQGDGAAFDAAALWAAA
jgi:predicted amidohydrolase